MKVLKRAVIVLMTAVVFLSGCGSLVGDIDLEAFRSKHVRKNGAAMINLRKRRRMPIPAAVPPVS